MSEVHIIMKWRDHGGDNDGDGQVHAVYSTEEEALARLHRIPKQNKQYPPRWSQGGRYLILGPAGDEGFFGSKPRHFWVVTAELLA